MTSRDRLIGTLMAVRPVLEEPGVLVVGSQVPNLLEQGAATTLVVSQDVDIGVPVTAHAAVKSKLKDIVGLRPSREEPSVWTPESDELIEVNFVGIDHSLNRPDQAYVYEDTALPMLVFGALSYLRPGELVSIGDLSVPVPRPAGLLIEKLVTDRSGTKGDRDLLVAMGLLLVSNEADLEEACALYESLPGEPRYTIRSSLAALSLLDSIPGMPDPVRHRDRVVAILRIFESAEPRGDE